MKNLKANQEQAIYVAPQMEMVEVEVEKGFAATPTGEIDPWG